MRLNVGQRVQSVAEIYLLYTPYSIARDKLKPNVGDFLKKIFLIYLITKHDFLKIGKFSNCHEHIII